MKVWLIQSVLSPYRIPLFEAIARAPGIDFTLILLSDKFKTRPQWKRDLATLPFKVEVPFGISYKINPEHQLCVNPFLVFKLLARRPDVVVGGGYSFAAISAWLYHTLTRKPYVIWTEATMHTDGGISGPRLRLRRLLARSAGAIVEAGTLAREYVLYLRPDAPDSIIFRAFNCIDNSQFMPTDDGNRDFLARKGLPRKNLLFVGKLNERKGIPTLLQVYKHVVARSKETIGLILIGEGPLKPDIERFKEENQLRHIYLEGWKSNQETAAYYSAADAFVLLSSADHNPLVLFEALAGGAPIICSTGAGNAVDFIADGINGFTVDPNDIETVVDRLLDVLQWGKSRRADCERYSRQSVKKANYADAADAFLRACRAARGAFGAPSKAERGFVSGAV